VPDNLKGTFDLRLKYAVEPFELKTKSAALTIK
jgi:hypothetical protein